MVVCKLDPAWKGVCSGSFTFYLKDPYSSWTLHLSEVFGIQKWTGNDQAKKNI